MTLNRYLSHKAAVALFWRIGDRLYTTPTSLNPRLFRRLTVIRRRLVDAFAIDFRNRPHRLDW